MRPEEVEDEPDDTSSQSSPSPQNFPVANKRSIRLTEASNVLALPNMQLLTGTAPQPAQPDYSSLLLSVKESNDQLPSNFPPTVIQRVRQQQPCIDPKDFVIPYTPITVEERLPGTNEVRTTVTNTCGMTGLPYTLHNDDPFDTKYPNFKTKLPPISSFLNFRRNK
uniref:Uncharacterized protein n=1 Tax=Elaeophora elaphi TaxID=1147741 RepID=A0A0R3S6G0_9BILA